MKTDKPFKTIDEQITILKSRNLIFLNEETAKNALSRYGYYEIINGYKDHFLVEEGNDEKGFKEGTTFEHIYALYNLDKDVSRDLLRALEDFEQTFKQTLAYVVADNISEIDSNYCASSHFNTGHIYKRDKQGHIKSDRSKLIRKFDRLKSSSKEPFHHYSKNHKNIPPWIMVKGLTFGQTLYWYRLSKPDIRRRVLMNLLGIKKIMASEEKILNEYSQLYGDIFDLYLSYRNLCAHGGRVFNHRSKKHLLRPSNFIYGKNGIDVSKRALNKGKYRSSVGIVVYTLNTFENENPAHLAIAWIINELNIYLKKYPEDEDYLVEKMELDLIPNIKKVFNS